MIEAVLFDMDGVLLDTERMGVRVLHDIAAELGYDMPDELYYRVLGVTNAEGRRAFEEAFGPEYPYDEAMHRFVERFAQLNREGRVPLKVGALEALRGLKARGLRTALATSTARWLVTEYMREKPELDSLLDVKLCGGDVARSKPHPDIYLAAARAVNAPPERCAGVEDSFNGVRALRAAGAFAIMVPDLLPFSERFAPYVDACLDDLRGLCPLLDERNE